MPDPKNYDNKDDFIKACIPIVIKEGKDDKQAVAICNSMWTEKDKMKTVTVNGFESPEFGEDLPKKAQDILSSTYSNCRLQWTKDNPKDKENKANKQSCAKIAWNAVKEAGFMKKEEMALKTVNIGDVEIFEAGEWKNNKYTEEDIDKMVNNFNNKIAEPYITIDHSDKASKQFKDALQALSLGFVDRLRRKGKKLIADFKQVPKTIADLIEAGALKKKSIEFYRQFIANGKLYNNVLQGVTFHGANGLPEVNTLSDFLSLYKTNLQVMQLSEDNEIESLNNEDFKKEELMETIELKKDEYNEFLKQKSQLVTLQEENEKLTEENQEIKEEKDEVVKENDDLKEKVESSEKEKEENLKKEAENFINIIIKDLKVEPVRKERLVNDYVRYKKGNVKYFEDFKSDLENRNKVLDNSIIQYPESGDIEDFKYNPDKIDFKEGSKINYDEIDKKIESYMKAKKVSYEQASIDLGFARKEEFGQVQEV